MRRGCCSIIKYPAFAAAGTNRVGGFDTNCLTTNKKFINMDSKFSFSDAALAAFRANIAYVKQPGQGVKTAPIANQELADLIGENGTTFNDVELVSFVCDSLPKSRMQSVGSVRLVREDNMEQRGLAVLKIGNKIYDTVPMHVPVALAFALNAKQNLIATKGAIESKNKARDGKFWISLTLPNEISTNDLQTALNTVFEQKPVESSEVVTVEL